MINYLSAVIQTADEWASDGEAWIKLAVHRFESPHPQQQQTWQPAVPAHNTKTNEETVSVYNVYSKIHETKSNTSEKKLMNEVQFL